MFKFAHSLPIFLIFAVLPASYAHAAVSPELGVSGTPKRSDVQTPSKIAPCGAVNIASTLDTSTAVPAGANGTVKVTVINFNGGKDGSRQVTAQVDPSGRGTKFVKMSILVNGDSTPNDTGPQPVTAQLPPGTRCTGGSQQDKCLVQFVTSAGFGNCVVVSQGDSNVKSSSTVKNARAASPAAGRDLSDQALDVAKKQDDKKGDKKNGKKGDGKNSKKGDKKKSKVRKAQKGGKTQKRDAAITSSSLDARAASPNPGLELFDRAEDAATPRKHNDKKNKKKNGKPSKTIDKKKQAGTRAPRALLADFQEPS